jgi:1-acyl-sn-glycerol-3-phosphate acyltransferase
MALQFGAPIIPVSIVGAFEFNRKTSWMLRPSRIVVHLHDTIETKSLDKRDVAALRERVRAVVAAPVDAHMNA